MSDTESSQPRKYKVTVFTNDNTQEIYNEVTEPEFQSDDCFTAILPNGKHLLLRSKCVTVEEL